VEAAWQIVDPILEHWQSQRGAIPQYEPGTPGPSEADALMEQGAHWRPL